MFSDQALASLDSDLKEEAEAVCGNDVTCLFDVAATGKIAFGKSTLEESTSINNEIANIGKYVCRSSVQFPIHLNSSKIWNLEFLTNFLTSNVENKCSNDTEKRIHGNNSRGLRA